MREKRAIVCSVSEDMVVCGLGKSVCVYMHACVCVCECVRACVHVCVFVHGSAILFASCIVVLNKIRKQNCSTSICCDHRSSSFPAVQSLTSRPHLQHKLIMSNRM